jgi:hypothetical protein
MIRIAPSFWWLKFLTAQQAFACIYGFGFHGTNLSQGKFFA